MKQPDREYIINRIKKLSRMTIERGCTKEEADAALSKIQKLMLEHDLLEKDIGAGLNGEDDEGYTSGWGCEEQTMVIPSLPQGILNPFIEMAEAIGAAFNTKIFYRPAIRQKFFQQQKKLIIAGRKKDIEMTIYFIESVFSNFNLSLKAHKKELKATEIKQRAEMKETIMESFSKKINTTMENFLEGMNVNTIETEIVFNEKNLNYFINKKINKFRRDSIFSFSVGFMLWMKNRFADIQKAREEQAKTSGYALIPVGFFDKTMNTVTGKRALPINTSRINESYIDGRDAALNCPIVEAEK